MKKSIRGLEWFYVAFAVALATWLAADAYARIIPVICYLKKGCEL